MPGHGDGSFDVTAYDLELDYRVASNHLDGRATLTVVAAADLSGIELDLAGLSVDKVTVDGRRPARFGLRGRRLFVRIAGGWAAGEEHEVVIRYSGQPRPLRGPWGEVGWEELTDGAIVAAQPNGAPSWFPCNDRPSTKATYRFVVTTESAYTVVANGRLVDRAVAASRTTWVYELDQPMATYLATVQIGRYDAQALDGDAVPQTVFAPARCREQVADELSRQPEMMSVFVEWFGAYPFDRYDVVVTDDDLEIPLEAQGLSIFGANHLDGTHHLERLVAHELAHQWFGNSLTLTTWSDIWLHEGFACYAEWLWSEESGGPTAADLAEKYYRRLADQPEDIVIAEPGPDLMFDDRLYKRGALTLHAVRTVLGDKAFAAVLLDWVRDHRHGSVTTAELERRFIAAGDVADLLVSWLHRPELPPLP